MKQDTQTALIQAGKTCFAQGGFDGTSVRDITRMAGTNLGAITYHFGSKRAFYIAVLQSATAPLTTATLAAARSDGTPEARVRAAIRAYFECIANDYDLGRLMLQELVLSKTPPDVSALPVRPVHAVLVELVKDGQANGDFRDGDPALLALSILSGPLHLNLARRALKAAAGIDFDDAATRERLLAHVTEFACAGLARRG